MELRFLAALFQPGRGEKQRVVENQDAHRNEDFRTHGIVAVNEELVEPSGLHQHRANGCGSDQKAPATVPGNRDQPDDQQADVTEQAERIVPAGLHQNGCEKTAEHAEHRHHQRVEPHRGQECHHRDECHQGEGWERSECLQMVERVCRKGDTIENQHGRGAKRLRQHLIGGLAVQGQPAD